MSNRLPPRRAGQSCAGPSRVPVVVAGLFLAFIAGLALTARLPPTMPWIYLGVSLVTFIAYAADKSAARDGRWRTPENTLHLLALLGGWPGALLAQYRLRHKSSKPSFLIVFWATVLLNCGALGWLLTANGSLALRASLGVG